jgi:hypothetical protein
MCLPSSRPVLCLTVRMHSFTNKTWICRGLKEARVSKQDRQRAKKGRNMIHRTQNGQLQLQMSTVSQKCQQTVRYKFQRRWKASTKNKTCSFPTLFCRPLESKWTTKAKLNKASTTQNTQKQPSEWTLKPISWAQAVFYKVKNNA